jgi:hypothetical protein
MPKVDLSDEDLSRIESALEIALDQFRQKKGPAASMVNNPLDVLQAVKQTEDTLKDLIIKIRAAKQAAQNQP